MIFYIVKKYVQCCFPGYMTHSTVQKILFLISSGCISQRLGAINTTGIEYQYNSGYYISCSKPPNLLDTNEGRNAVDVERKNTRM